MLTLLAMLLPLPALSKTHPAMVIALFREGALKPKTPSKAPDSDAPDFYGDWDLIDSGIRQTFNLGRILRKDYAHLLSSSFQFQNVNITSSYVNSTLASAVNTLAGIYDSISPYQLETPGASENYLPMWDSQLEGDGDGDGDDDDVLPGKMSLSGVGSLFNGTDFLFRSDHACSFIREEMAKNLNNADDENYEVFKDARELLRAESSVRGVVGQNDDFKSLFESVKYLLYEIYKDPLKLPYDISYEMQAHMIFIESVYYFSLFKNDETLQYYLTNLFEEWRDLAEYWDETLVKGAEQGAYHSPVQLYFGFPENLSGLIIKLQNSEKREEIIEYYKSKKEDIKSIQSEKDFTKFLQTIDDEKPIANLGFTANVVLELLPETKGNRAR